MGFFMDGLEAEAYDRTYKDSALVRRVIGYFKPQAGRMAIVALVIALNSLTSLALPIYISRSLDRLQADPQGTNLFGITLILVGLASLGWVFNAVRGWFSAQAVGNVVLQLREDAFDAVLRRDLSFYDQFPSGKIVSRVTSDTQAFSQVVTLTMDLLSRILAPFLLAAALAFRKIARDTITQQRRVQAEVSSHIQETISGIRVAKTFRREHSIFDEFLDVNRKSFWIGLRTGFVFSSIFPILDILAGVGTAALVYYGGLTARAGDLSAGDWFLFIQGIGLFWFPLTSIASFWSQFQLGLAAAERVFALLDAEPKVVQIGQVRLPEVKGEIRFEGVDFHYHETEPVLADFSLTIGVGETLALVGHTGSGKSSIAKLIARFYEFQGGRIAIDGHDIRTLALRAYRSHLGIVTQTPFLFDGPVLDNIRYGRPAASDEEVIAVARAVGKGDWIDSLPDGLQTQVGERGASLSMGQRQLVALARVGSEEHTSEL